MAKFEYTRNATLEAYGKVFEIPTKTADYIDGINDINKRLAEAKDSAEHVEILREGVAFFIGEEETERIFPAEKIRELDSDELSAFWWALNEESNRVTREIIERYAPNRTIRKAQ